MGIILKERKIMENRVDYVYDYPESWNFLKNPDERLFVEYGFSLKEIPASILNIPFIANMLIFAMFDGTSIEVDDIDRAFLESIPNILDGYRKLYGDRIKNVEIRYERVVDNSYGISDESVMAFTGGVDATSAVASHIHEKLILANIWGGDIRLNNPGRQKAHEEYFHRLAEKYGYGVSICKSNFRALYDSKKIPYKTEHFWWGAFGHSITIIALLAPIAFVNRAEHVYIGSSYELRDMEERHIGDCNYAPIINNFKFASCSAQQCDTYLRRSQKIGNIATAFEVSEENPVRILACWNQKKQVGIGGNCCHCEKCMRSIMDIVANGYDPRCFGFDVNHEVFSFIRYYVQNHNVPVDMWLDIQDAFLKNKEKWADDKRVNWILNTKIDKEKITLAMWIRRAIYRVLKK